MTDPGRNLRVLVLEDSDDDARLAVLALERHGYAVEWQRADGEQGVLEAVAGVAPDVVLADHAMPRLDSRRALELLHEHDRELPFILVSGTIGEEAAADLLRRGASDFVSKGHLERLGPAVHDALAEARVRAERARAEEAMRQSERRYRSLVTATSDFLWWCDADGVLYDMDRAWLEYTGLSREQALGWGSKEAFHPDDRDAYVAAWEDAIRTGSVFEHQYRVRGRDGSYGWFIDRAAPVRGADDAIVEWVGASRDVSVQVEAEERLRASEAGYRALFQEAPDAILVTIGDRITDCNARAPELLGRRREELIGAAIGSGAFSPPAQPDGTDSATRLAELKRAALNGETQRFEWAILRGDGSTATADVVFGHLAHAGEPGLHVILRDVSEQKRAERALAESEARYRMLFDDAPSGILLMQDARFVECNAAAAAIFGYEHDEIMSMMPWDVSPEYQPDGRHSREKAAAMVRAALDGQPQDFEWEHVRRDGTRVSAEIRLRRLDGVAGANLHAIMTDVTERRRAEEALRRSEADYHALFEAVPDGVFLLREDGSYIDCNARVEQVFGWSREWLAGRTFADISPEVQPDGQASLAKGRGRLEAAAAGEIQHFEWQVLRADGSPALLEVALGPLERAGDASLFAIGRDVTAQRELEQREREHHAILQGISDGTTDAIFVKDLEGRYVHINAAGADALGLGIDDVLGRTSADLFPPEQAARIADVDRAVLESGEARWVDETLFARDGERRYSTTIGVCRDAAGEPIGTFGIARDVTEKRRTEAEMRKLSRALEQSADAVVITDAQRVIEYVNPAFERVTGYPAAEAIGRDAGFLASGHDDDSARERLRDDLAAGREFHGVLLNRRRSGELYHADATISPVRDDNGRVTNYIGSHYDISEKLRTEQELVRLTHYDPVTELPNRSLVLDRVAHLVTQARRFGWRIAVLHIDVDGFSLINESLGREGGDQVLRAVAQRLVETIGDTLSVGRVGNDGFIALVTLTGSDERADHWAGRIQSMLAEPIAYGDEAITLTATVGLAIAPDDAGDAESLLEHAEAALHRAREQGREQVAFYAPAMTEEARRWLTLESGLRRALEHEEFYLEYQPQVDLASGSLSGVEALLRWQHPERGRVSPGEFMPLLEKSGLIVPVGEWVIREACRRVGEWRSALAAPGADADAIRVSVNLSLVQFERRDLVSIVREALEHTGTDARQLELELTESSLARNAAEAARTLHALRALGVSIALDDFGTGYSSLNYLKWFPIDVVKVDRAFVEEITQDPRDAAVLRVVLELARSRGMKMVAEGVETAEQVRFLVAEGCRHAQGFYFSAAVDGDALGRLLAEGQPFQPLVAGARGRPTVLAVSGEARTGDAVRAGLEDQGYEVVVAESIEQALAAMAADGGVRVVVADGAGRLPAVDLLARVQALYPRVRRILAMPDAGGAALRTAVNAGTANRVLASPLDHDELRREVAAAFADYEALEVRAR